MDTRHKQKRRGINHYKRNRNLQAEGAIQGIIESDCSNDGDTSATDQKTFSRKPLQSNWSRYDEPSDEEDDEEYGATDFEALSKQPPTLSGHFQFSAEKEWQKELEEPPIEHEFSQYFTLNMSLINAGLDTIPFYKLMEYDSAMFDPGDIRRMDAAAEAAESNYQEVLKRHEENRKNPPPSRTASAKRKDKAGSSGVSRPGSSTTAPKVDEKDDQLDELLNMTMSQVAEVGLAETKEEGEASAEEKKDEATTAEAGEVGKTEETKVKNVESKEDMQQWLDDILDQ